MGRKRKRPFGEDDDAGSGGGSPPQVQEPSTKRRRSAIVDPSELFLEVFETVRSFKDETGRVVCESFIRVPKRRNTPEYYDIICNPIDLLKIQQRLKTDEYTTLDSFTSQMELLFTNAKTFYPATSQEHKDADTLLDVLWSTCQRLFPVGGAPIAGSSWTGKGDGRPVPAQSILPVEASSPPPVLAKDASEEDAFQVLLDVVLKARDASGRMLCEMFMRLPSKAQYPEYYRVITEPMDLRTVEQAIKARRYRRLKDVEDDLMLMVKNAKHFNEPGSQIYKDAVMIGKEISAFMIRLSKSHPSFLKPRPSLKVTLKPPISRKAEPDSSSDTFDEDDSIDEEEHASENDMSDGTSTSWSSIPEEKKSLFSLFDTVRSHTSSSGRVLSKMFMRLPSRRTYPEYYIVIKEPLSLLQVHRRLRSDHYKDLDELVKDLNLVFTNAQMFNKPQSRISRNAAKLVALVRKSSAQLKSSSSSGKEGPLRLRFTRIDSKLGQQKGSFPLLERLSALYELVVSTKEADGRQTCADFLQLPQGAEKASYLQTIPQPIDLQQISLNIASGRYNSLDEFRTDIHLLVENARTFRGESSDMYKSGRKLEELVNKQLAIYQQVDGAEVLPPVKPASGGRPLSRQSSFDTWQPCPLTDEQLRLGEAAGAVNVVKAGIRIFQLDQKYFVLGSDVGYCLGLLRGDLYKRHPGLGRRYVSDAAERKSLVAQGMHSSANQFTLLLPSEVEPLIIAKQEKDQSVVKGSPLRGSPLCTSSATPGSGGSPLRRSRPALAASPALHGGPMTMRKPGRPPTSKPVVVTGSDSESKQALLEIVTNYTDQNGRKLSAVFEDLPSKADYPDYYKVIKKPIDLKTIERRLNGNQYPSIEELGDELLLMFDNACQFNEPGSIIYQDALQLQNLVLRKKTQLLGEKVGKGKAYGAYPDVSLLVRQLLAKLLQSMLTYEDVRGRCLSQVIAQLPEREAHDAHKKVASKAISLPAIKKNMNEGGYHRLDTLQGDVFGVCERTRRMYSPGNQTFDDASHLQRFFIQCRDELCGQGQVLESPALSYGLPNLEARLVKLAAAGKEGEAVTVATSNTQTTGSEIKAKTNAVKAEKPSNGVASAQAVMTDLTTSSAADGQEGSKSSESANKVDKTSAEPQRKQQDDSGVVYLDSVTVNSQVYSTGDVVYVQGKEEAKDSHIVIVEKIWRDDEGEWIFGNWFYRPVETFHVATRKFLEKEVFKSDYSAPVKATHIIGRCFVMFAKDYFKQQPEGLSDEDVFVCESRYLTRQKQFKKIKVWSLPPSSVKIKPRAKALPMRRVESVFASKTSTSAAEMAMQTEQAALSDNSQSVPRARVSSRHIFDGPYSCMKPQLVERAEQNAEEGCTYYEQYILESGCFKLGDCVYVRSDQEEPFIARIDRMWTDRNADPWFHGPWFVRPSEVEHLPSRMFYKHEVLMSSIHDTNPMRSILSPCSVLDVPTYTRSRITHIPEKDVYVCESRYNEADKQIRRLKGLKVFQLSNRSVADEWYYFSEEIAPLKVPSPLLKHVEETDSTVARDAAVPATPQAIKSAAPSTPAVMTTPVSTTTPSTPLATPTSGKVRKQPSMTGYLLYAGERRRELKQTNPQSTFGELSREIGSEWRHMSDEQKAVFEERALALVQAQENANQMQQQQSGVEVGQTLIYECRWEGCDHQYEDVQEMANHLLNNHTTGHIMTGKGASNEYFCKWTVCPRHKSHMPFPSCSKIMRHLREVHLRTCQRTISQSQRSANYFIHKRGPSPGTGVNSRSGTTTRTPAVPPASASSQQQTVTRTNGAVSLASLDDGTYPTRMTAVHSSIYSSYVRRLQQGQGQQSPWQDVVSPTQPSPPVSQLPRNWLPGVSDPEQVLQALVSLRQLFVRDAACLSQWTT